MDSIFVNTPLQAVKEHATRENVINLIRWARNFDLESTQYDNLEQDVLAVEEIYENNDTWYIPAMIVTMWAIVRSYTRQNGYDNILCDHFAEVIQDQDYIEDNPEDEFNDVIWAIIEGFQTNTPSREDTGLVPIGNAPTHNVLHSLGDDGHMARFVHARRWG